VWWYLTAGSSLCVWLLVSAPGPEGQAGICLHHTPQEQGIFSVDSLCALCWRKKCPNFYVNVIHMLPCSPLAGLGPCCPTPPDLSALPHLSIPLLRSPTPAWQCHEEKHPSGSKYQAAVGLAETFSWCIQASVSATCRCRLSCQPDAAQGCRLPWTSRGGNRHGEAIECLLAGGQGCFSK